MTIQLRLSGCIAAFAFFFFIPASTNAQTVIKCCNCNKTVETLATGFGEDRSVLKLCDECKAKRCRKIGEIRALLAKIITPEPLHSPTVAEWRNSIGSQKNSLDIYLSGLERSYCDDESMVVKIRQMRADLQALDPGPEYASGQLLRERMKVAEIDLALEGMEGGSCAKKDPSNQLDKITCPPDAEAKKPSDTEVLEEYLKDKLKEAGKTLAEGTKLEDHLKKISTGKDYWSYWQQILAAQCIPPALMQALNGYIAAKKNGEDTADECTTLCAQMADWFVTISGNAPGRQMFMESCWNHCK